MNLVIANRQRRRKINSQLLKEIASELLAKVQIEEAELGINLVAAPEMTALNKTFLKHEGSTDVITFDYAGEETGARAARPRVPLQLSRGRAAGAPLHGEIFVCVDEAIWQAKKFKTTWQSEVVRYLVHGFLHLLGHDDVLPTARRKMKRAENGLVCELSHRFDLSRLGTLVSHRVRVRE